MMDDEQPFFEARNEDDKSDVRNFKVDVELWVRQNSMAHVISREAIVRLRDEFILVKDIHVISLDPSEEHCGTFRFLERREAAKWYLMNGWEFPAGLARLVDGKIVLDESEEAFNATESDEVDRNVSEETDPDLPIWVSASRDDAKIAVKDFLKELGVENSSTIALTDGDVRDLLVVRVRCNNDLESIPDTMPEPEEWMKPSETRDFILKHFGKKILVDGSKRPLERIKAAKRIRSDYTAAGITKICKFLKG